MKPKGKPEFRGVAYLPPCQAAKCGLRRCVKAIAFRVETEASASVSTPAIGGSVPPAFTTLYGWASILFVYTSRPPAVRNTNSSAVAKPPAPPFTGERKEVRTRE